MSIKVTIHGQLPTLNEANNKARTHWAIAAKQKKDATNLVAIQCATMPIITKPVTITFYWFFSTRHDFDNIRSAAKFILDGMIVAGKLPNDNQTWVKGFGGDIFTKVNKGDEKVVVVLNEAE